MFDEEVMFFFFNFHPTLCADSTFRCPEIWLLFSMMITSPIYRTRSIIGSDPVTPGVDV